MRSRALIPMLLVSVTLSAGAHPEGGMQRCGGTVPDTLSCSTGVHDHVLPIFHGLQVFAPTDLTGVVRSAYHWPAVEGLPEMFSSVFSCRVSGGVFVSCSSSGTPAPPGVRARHECGVTELDGLEPEGHGRWECSIVHDQVPPPMSQSTCAAPYAPGVSQECSFTFTARPLGVLASFPGTDLARMAVDIVAPDDTIVARCTPQFAGAVCAILWDSDLAFGTDLRCVVRDLGGSARTGMFGCSAGL